MSVILSAESDVVLSRESPLIINRKVGLDTSHPPYDLLRLAGDLVDGVRVSCGPQVVAFGSLIGRIGMAAPR